MDRGPDSGNRGSLRERTEYRRGRGHGGTYTRRACEGAPRGKRGTVMRGTDWAKRKDQGLRTCRAAGVGVRETGQKDSHGGKDRGTIGADTRKDVRKR